MKKRKWIPALAFAAALLIWPETALNAAREAMAAWTYTVAPALFPFMALMPLLTSPDAARAYERLLGRLMQTVFRLPGAAATAIVIGMTAGSPAGATAAARISDTIGLPPDQRERLVTCVCGLSPAFLITGIGTALLNSPADGRILLVSQLCTQLTMLILTRPRRITRAQSACAKAPAVDPVHTAIIATLGVCGYMILFNTAAALLAEMINNEIIGRVALIIFDLPSGARTVSSMNIPRETKLLALSALAGYGGLCIAAQNLNACPGISMPRYLLKRLIAALITTGYTAIQLIMNVKLRTNPPKPLPTGILFSAIFAVPGLIFLEIDQFLNIRRGAKNTPKTP